MASSLVLHCWVACSPDDFAVFLIDGCFFRSMLYVAQYIKLVSLTLKERSQGGKVGEVLVDTASNKQEGK